MYLISNFLIYNFNILTLIVVLMLSPRGPQNKRIIGVTRLVLPGMEKIQASIIIGYSLITSISVRSEVWN